MGGEADQVRWRGVRPVEGIRGIWPARNAERFFANAARSISGISIVYTVPAAKTLFVSSLICASRLAVSANVHCYIYIADAVPNVICRAIFHYYSVQGQQTTAQRYVPAIEVPTGGTLRIYNSAGDLQIEGIFSGWLEDD